MKTWTLDEVLKVFELSEDQCELLSKMFDENYGDNFRDSMNALYRRVEIRKREDGCPELVICMPFNKRNFKKKEGSKLMYFMEQIFFK